MSATSEKQGGWFAGLLSVVTTTVLLVALILAVAVAVVPRLVGGAALTVLTGSMEPTYSPGDMVVVRGVDDPGREVRIGDAVTFQPVSGDPTLITHRVVGKRFTSTGMTFVTRGDANGADDDPIKPEQIMGTVMYAVPYVGHLAAWVGSYRTPLITGAAVALILYGAVMLVRPDRSSGRRTRRRPSRDADDTAPTPDQSADLSNPTAVGR
jgi:signal peptidase